MSREPTFAARAPRARLGAPILRSRALLLALVPVLSLAAVPACSGTGGAGATHGPAVHPDEWQTLDRGELVPALLTLVEIEERGDASAAAWLLPLLRDGRREHELRAGVAATLLSLGFPEGQDFCIAVLRANLAESAESDRRYQLPQHSRWAFARELAYEAVARRLRGAGVEPVEYEVNFGAPDLARATSQLEAQLRSLPAPAPAQKETSMAGRLPEAPPAGWSGASYDTWTRVRDELIRRYDRG